MSVHVSLPGVAWRSVCDGGFPNDDVARWERINDGALVMKAGFGRKVELDLSEHDAADLHTYIDSLVGVLDSMSNEELGESGGIELRACRVAYNRLREARGQAPS